MPSALLSLVRRHLPVVVLVVILTAGCIGSLIVYRFEQRTAIAAFELNADEMIDRIQNRVEQHFTLLVATVAFAAAIGDTPDASTFRSFVGRLGLEENFSGVRGLGFGALIETGDEAMIVDTLFSNYGLERAVWPATSQDRRVAVTLLEPQDERSRAALGFDMFSDTVRRQAILRAMGTRRIALTAPLRLVQEPGEDPQPGFVAYMALPVPPGSTATKGFFYASFRAGDLHRAALGNSSRDAIEIETRDTTNGLNEVVYRSPRFEEGDPSSLFNYSMVLNLGGREWTIFARPAPGQTRVSHVFTVSFAAIFAALAAAAAAAAVWQGRAVQSAQALQNVMARTVEEKDLLLQEMKHRIKNSIARILAIARQTGLSASTIAEFNASFSSRLQAMAGAQEMLTRSLWRRADLGELLAKELQQVFGADIQHTELNGPPVMLEERTVQALGLTFHELATNSLKYGAAGSADGKVVVNWTVHDDHVSGQQLELEWRELRTLQPFNDRKRGFGSRLIDINITSELGGVVDRVATDSGFSLRISIPLRPAP